MTLLTGKWPKDEEPAGGPGALAFAAQTCDIIGGSGRRSPRSRGWSALLDRMISFAVEPKDRPDLIRTKRLFNSAR